MKLRMALTLGITLGLGCDRPMAPSAESGGVTLGILSASDNGSSPLDLVRILVRGPTNRTIDAAPGTTVTIAGLAPGAYTVALEGFSAGEVDRFGETSPVPVLAGQSTTATVTFASFVPVVVSLPPSAKDMSFTVSYGSVAGAASYEVEAATDQSFTANRIAVSTGDTSAKVTVPNYGSYYVRVRAVDRYGARGRPSASQFIVVSCDCWTTAVASMPTPRGFLGVAVINGVLYAVGGANAGVGLATVEAYDPASNTWTTKASMPTPRAELGVAVVNGVLYAVGGNKGGFSQTTVEAYDPASNTWTTKASMPTGRLGLGATVVNGVLYAVGGNNTSCTPSCTLGTVEAYDPASNTWTPKAPMPTRRSRLGLAVVNGVLYAVGGENPILATVEAYDPASNTWTSKAPMPTPRSGLGVAMAGGVLYAVGGYNSVSGYLATVEAYQP